MEDADAASKIGPDAQALRKLEDLEQAITIARATRNAAATQLAINYEPGADGRVQMEGAALIEGTAYPISTGVRLVLQDIGDPDWILQPALAPALDAMADCGLVFDALIQPRHLRRILVLCQRHPALRVVVDHGAKPAIAQGLWQPWADDLRLLARDTQAVCKMSGLLTEAGPRPPRDVALRWIAHLLEVFGPQRMLWGSDWPVLELAATYDDWWADTQTALAGLTATDRAAVLGGNAMQVYRL